MKLFQQVLIKIMQIFIFQQFYYIQFYSAKFIYNESKSIRLEKSNDRILLILLLISIIKNLKQNYMSKEFKTTSLEKSNEWILLI